MNDHPDNLLERIASVTITLGNRELREGRDFDVDYATGVITMHRGGVVTITAAAAPAWWTAPRPAKRRRVAQWKSERRGGRRP